MRFVPFRDSLTLTIGDSYNAALRGVQEQSPFHKAEMRPFYPLIAENRSNRACVVALSVQEPLGLPDGAPQFSPEWAEWRLPPVLLPEDTTDSNAVASALPPNDSVGVDALSPDCRILHLLLLPGQQREIALEVLPAYRTAAALDYLFAVGGQEVNTGAQSGARLQPAVGSLRLVHGENSLMALLPEVYREAAREERQQSVEDMPSFGERFLLGFSDMAEALDAGINIVPELFGVDTAPEEWLRWLATWVGLTLDDRWPEMRRRELIRHAITLYRRRGTVVGLADYLELFTGVRPQISDTPVEGMRLGPSARLGSPGTWLGHIAPHTFVVTLSPGRATSSTLDRELREERAGIDELLAIPDTPLEWDAVTIAALHDIIAVNKPAHTAYELRVLREGATPVTVQSVPDETETPAANSADNSAGASSPEESTQ